MAQKRKQTLDQELQQDTKRMKTKSSRPTSQRAHHNQLMAQAALARISRAKQPNQQNEQQPPHPHPATPNATSPPPDNEEHNHKLEIDNLNQTISTYKAVIESQTTLIDSIKSSLSCNICFEIIDSPYALLCGHIFCHKDLYAWFHRSNSSSSAQHDHRHHHPIPDHQSSDSERIGSALSQTINLEAGGALTTTNENGSDRTEPARPPNTTDQEGHPVQLRDGRTNNSHNNQPPARARPISPRRKRQNLICPQCRAAVTGRPISLYAIKEVTSQLKSSEASICASSTSAAIPIPSSSNSNSFRNLVESHRDEKDLTWGNLFPAALPTSNSTGATQDLARFIIDPQDGVRRCGRCAWEIGPNGLCEGCGAAYADFADDSESSSDSSFQMHSEESDYMRTDFSEEGGESDDSEGNSIGSERFAWGTGRHNQIVHRAGLAWVEDEEDDSEGEEEPSSDGSHSSDEVRVIGIGGNTRRNVIRVSSDSEVEDHHFGPPSDNLASSTRFSDASSSIPSRRSDSIHSIRPEYISSDDHEPNRLESDHWRRPTSDDDDDDSFNRSEPNGDPRMEPQRGPWMRGSSDSDDRSDGSGSVMIREVVHFRPGSERSFGTPESSDDCERWSGIHRISSDEDAPEDHGSPAPDDPDDDDEDDRSDHSDDVPSPHEDHWDSDSSSVDDDYY